jgi:hypothetical protein
MGQSLLDKLQAKLELLRLEKRYTRHRHRRSTFVSNAVYVDGEYIYQTPNTTGGSSSDSSVRIDALHGEKPSRAVREATAQVAMDSTSPAVDVPSAERKRLHRFSSIAGFGSILSQPKDLPRIEERRISMVNWTMGETELQNGVATQATTTTTVSKKKKKGCSPKNPASRGGCSKLLVTGLLPRPLSLLCRFWHHDDESSSFHDTSHASGWAYGASISWVANIPTLHSFITLFSFILVWSRDARNAWLWSHDETRVFPSLLSSGNHDFFFLFFPWFISFFSWWLLE